MSKTILCTGILFKHSAHNYLCKVAVRIKLCPKGTGGSKEVRKSGRLGGLWKRIQGKGAGKARLAACSRQKSGGKLCLVSVDFTTLSPQESIESSVPGNIASEQAKTTVALEAVWMDRKKGFCPAFL